MGAIILGIIALIIALIEMAIFGDKLLSRLLLSGAIIFLVMGIMGTALSESAPKQLKSNEVTTAYVERTFGQLKGAK